MQKFILTLRSQFIALDLDSDDEDEDEDDESLSPPKSSRIRAREEFASCADNQVHFFTKDQRKLRQHDFLITNANHDLLHISQQEINDGTTSEIHQI